MNKSGIVRVPFRIFSAETVASAIFQRNLYPLGMSSRLATLADGFDMFRVTELAFRIHPNGTRTAVQSVSFYPGITDTAPGSTSVNSECIDCAILGTGQTHATEWQRVPPAHLKGYFTWYKTLSSSLDPTEEIQGMFFGVSTGTETISVEYRGVFEFKNGVSTSVTPMLKTSVRREVMRDKILGLLAAPPASAGDTAVSCKKLVRQPTAAPARSE